MNLLENPMEIWMREEKGKILKAFYKLYPDLPFRMRNTLISYEQGMPSNWHLEDDVWSHTMMVLHNVKFRRFDNMSKAAYKALFLTALMHDVGKVNRISFEKYGKAGFPGHAHSATKYIAPLCEQLYGYDHDYERILELTLFAVSHHMNVHEVVPNFSKDDFMKYFNYDYEQMAVSIDFGYADIYGRLSGNELKFPEYPHITAITENMNKEKYQVSKDDIDCWVYCYPPGANILWYVDQGHLDYVRVRVETLLQIEAQSKSNQHLAARMTPYQLLKEMRKIKNIPELVLKEFKDRKDDDKFLILDFNLSKRPRSSFAHMIKNIYPNKKVGCKVIMPTLSKLYADNEYPREGNISYELSDIYKELEEFVFPTMNDGFDRIEFRGPR